MWHKVTSLFQTLANAVTRLDTNDWAVISVFMIIAGLICMRGFGDRKRF